MSLGLAWAPLAVPIYAIGNAIDPNAASIVALVVLYAWFLYLAGQWRRIMYADTQPFQTYGWQPTQRSFWVRLILGGMIGLSSITLLFGLQLALGLATLTPNLALSFNLVGSAILVAIAVGCAEELLFRGWLLQELVEQQPRQTAYFVSSVIFAIAHFIKPLNDIIATSPQFVGLVLLGYVLGVSKTAGNVDADPAQTELKSHKTSGSLGMPIGLHAGLIGGYYLVDVGDLIRPNSDVNPWITGIHNNPLAGLLGIGLLLILAIGLNQFNPAKFRR